MPILTLRWSPRRVSVVKRIVLTGLMLCAVASPVWAGEAESFDPDQPFTQALSQRWLKSALEQALDVLADHVEITGSLNPDAQQGDRQQRLAFKFYPEGKSKSDEHVAAEGWFGPSKDANRQEFHFRFALPKSSPKPSTAWPENVL